MEWTTTLPFAESLDKSDPLASFRSYFAIPDPNLIYLDGNSLGRLSNASDIRVHRLIIEWSRDLIRGFNKDWWQAPGRVGEKIAQLVGAGPGQVVVIDSVSVNLFCLASAALTYNNLRTKIVTDSLNFPSDLYVIQGLVQMLGNKHSIVRIGSKDRDITPNIDELLAKIDNDTALVTLSHVTFKSGYLYDMAALTELAHRHGALVLWDLSHSVGAVPVELDACKVDLAVGCTYKYLNGGPGSPAFLYVRKDLQDKMTSPVWGWWGHKEPFAFNLDYEPAAGIMRFLTGTQPILSLLSMEAALDPLLSAGMDNMRRKSLLMSEYLIFLADELLIPLGFTIGSPRDPKIRGSHVSLRHPEGYRINQALIEEMEVIPDFREPDNIRFGLSPLYTTFTELWEAVDRIRKVMINRVFERFGNHRLSVT
jgi:kynureninase